VTTFDTDLTGLSGVPLVDAPAKAQDFKSDQEVRWCPGCGDYVVLNAVQSFLPTLGIRRENIVFISGIGCSSRFPYYLNTYGFHSIHGRAPTLATGLVVARPDLSVWVVTGDGDALSIGGNHLIHALRRNVNVKILLFNNRIYGLTKGQYSPTSEQGKVTKSTPMGAPDAPFDPVALALGAGASFVARALDSDRKGLTEVLTAAAAHRGAALVEIYQNCPIFNDGAFDGLRGPASGIPLRHGEPIVFGPDKSLAVARNPRSGALEVTDSVAEALVHDATAADPSVAIGLSGLGGHVPFGVFRAAPRATYDDLVRDQVYAAMDTASPDLGALLRGSDGWTVS